MSASVVYIGTPSGIADCHARGTFRQNQRGRAVAGHLYLRAKTHLRALIPRMMFGLVPDENWWRDVLTLSYTTLGWSGCATWAAMVELVEIMREYGASPTRIRCMRTY